MGSAYVTTPRFGSRFGLSVTPPMTATDLRDRRPEPRKGWRDEECIENAWRRSAGPLDAGFSAHSRGPREIADFVGWVGARPPSSQRCAEHRGRDTLMWKNRLQPYDLLSKDEVNTIHGQAMTILEEIGIDFLHDGARELFQKSGMRIEDNRVRFERAFVMEQVAKTPATFEFQARNSAHTVTLGGDNVVTAPVYGPPFVTDLERGRRGATLEDFSNFDKLSQAVVQNQCDGGRPD